MPGSRTCPFRLLLIAMSTCPLSLPVPDWNCSGMVAALPSCRQDLDGTRIFLGIRSLRELRIFRAVHQKR
jgi:hypothetical protein